MTHVRVDDVAQVHRRSSCRRGSHRYEGAQQVGGGIRRRVCVACGSVSIDLATPVPADDRDLATSH